MAHTTPFILTSRVSGAAGYPHDQMHNLSPVKTVSAVFDGAAVTLYKGSAVATSDVTQLISIPAGAFVLNVTCEVTTAEGATCTFGVGDGATYTSGYLASVNGNSTSTNSASFNATTTQQYGVGKYYSAADTIDVILTTGTAAAVVAKISATYIVTKPVGI